MRVGSALIRFISTIRRLVSAIMDIPKDYLAKIRQSKKLKITSERQELIQQFVDKINLERVGTKFKPVIWQQVNGLLGHVRRMSDLYWLFKECEQGESFSKKFFGILKNTRLPKK